jgi:hypothetical protein
MTFKKMEDGLKNERKMEDDPQKMKNGRQPKKNNGKQPIKNKMEDEKEEQKMKTT